MAVFIVIQTRPSRGVKQADRANWLKVNADLSYTEMQVKCLRWLLQQEKAIGACDAESYFVNILPLEIRILEYRLAPGDCVAESLEEVRRIQSEKLADKIPRELLSAG